MVSSFSIVTRAPVPAEALFDVSLSIDEHVASMGESGERAIGGVTAGTISLGETVTWRARHFGIWFTMTSQITSLERPHRFVDEQVRGPFRSFHHEHRFARESDVTTMTDTITLASPVFGRVAERIILVPYLRRLIRIRNAHLLSALGVTPSTYPERATWPDHSHHGYRRSEVTALIGRGEQAWERAARDVLQWAVKTRSGFTIDDASPVTPGAEHTITAKVAGITVREPVRVVSVVETDDRVGFSYRTLPGHPVDGEEAFVVHRGGDEVHLTVRSLMAPGRNQPWRALHPFLRMAQVVARRRYLRALTAPSVRQHE